MSDYAPSEIQGLPREPGNGRGADLIRIGDSIRNRIEAERVRLAFEAGLTEPRRLHFKRPVERPFTRSQRATTTLLFGGLTWKHERLIHGALEGLGYKVQSLPVPDVKAFQTGKEFGNNGQCNPTYFTVGNLVQFLQSLETRGLTREQIIDQYVFFTAGACGPCRFGMYEAEYRLALRNSGFEGFRVILFQQSGGLTQSDVEAGIEMNLDFFLGILNALNAGDVVNEAAYAMRPYEVTAGDTAGCLDRVMDSLHRAFRAKRPWKPGDDTSAAPGRFRKTAACLRQFADQLWGNHYTQPLLEAARLLDSVELDRLRVKPIVKVTGEFWAQTTEGDGNFRMFRFLEEEGAQVLVEPIGTWITYMIHQVVQKYRDTKGLDEGAAITSPRNPFTRARMEPGFWLKIGKLKLAEAVFRREYHRLALVFGSLVHPLTDQYELQRLGHPYYNSRAAGGEGHLEVAKNIYYSNRDLAHMVLSLKPFGCMPSTQSDAAQTAVIANHRDMIYLPIETSGEGGINAHSRVQMALGEARSKARLEFAHALQQSGLSIAECHRYVDQHPEMKRPLYRVPKHKGVTGVAANFVLHIAARKAHSGA
jgi:predicted nucleotide-binding protein (sugar kinase/HSP70/actin superfamily)